ncbi:phosphopantetheine-binding protein [Aureliella helgolandensis]|uniref:Carrier domain-containing protein n=1 Tax=Aureliella helgolandensis TaxID=2527968 RepID=A0A518GC59_9BACT|nr:phosphopantetheine-binding protein [Aureliella helgolandensis]QDV26137.1 hypothetical protein Q31a_45090 [Aureliella helgolandensis]
MNVLIEILNEILDDAGRETVSVLSPNLRLKEDLGMDSLEMAVLTVKLEAMTGVDVFANGVVRTIGEIQEQLSA